MSKNLKGVKVTLSNIPTDLWERCKAEAARAGMSANDWVTEALAEKLENAIDIREGVDALDEPGEDIPWEVVKEGIEASAHSSV